MINNIEVLLNELGRVSMCQENSSYNDITEMQSSNSYQMMIDNLYSKAVSDLYYLDESQRSITIRRIDEVRERQEYFNVPTIETVNSMLRDYNAQPEGKRNKSLLDEYHYCKFVLECVAIQKEYLDKFASLVTVEKSQETSIKTEPDKNIGKGTYEDIDGDSNSDTSNVALKNKAWLSIDETVALFGLPKNSIKSRKWRVNNDFPYKGYDENKKPYTKVIFYSEDIEAWLKTHKR